MSDFSTELEILQDENFAIKAPKGFKGDAWQSKSGRPGRVLYSRFSPDYMDSDCYITVSTIAMNPITSEIRKRIERFIGTDGFSFEFRNEDDRHVVLYAHEEEVDYRTYHAFVLMNEQKAILMDVIFNSAYDNSKEVAENIIMSLRANFKDATEEEIAADAARLAAEDKAEAAKEAAKRAQMQAAQGGMEEVTTVQMVEENAVESALDVPEQAVSEVVEPVAEESAQTVEETAELVAEESVEEEIAETVPEPEFDDSEEGQQKRVIYDTMKQTGHMTLSELQAVPELLDVGRMGITKLLNMMIRDEILVRYEEADNIYFALPGQQIQQAESDAAQETAAEGELDPMEQYKIDMERYKQELAEWKKSRNFLTGRSDKPKPVEPVKPKKKK
jgi:hypothetical protein